MERTENQLPPCDVTSSIKFTQKNERIVSILRACLWTFYYARYEHLWSSTEKGCPGSWDLFLITAIDSWTSELWWTDLGKINDMFECFCLLSIQRNCYCWSYWCFNQPDRYLYHCHHRVFIQRSLLMLYLCLHDDLDSMTDKCRLLWTCIYTISHQLQSLTNYELPRQPRSSLHVLLLTLLSLTTSVSSFLSPHPFIGPF